MAVEFHCPYCTARIRVPDQYSGKRGTCPKCGTRLIVPDVVPPHAVPPHAAPPAGGRNAGQAASSSSGISSETSPPVPAATEDSAPATVGPAAPAPAPFVSNPPPVSPPQAPPSPLSPPLSESEASAASRLPDAAGADVPASGSPLPTQQGPSADFPNFVPPAETGSLSRRLKRKTGRRKSQRLYAVAVPVVCFVLFFGVVGLIVVMRSPELKGTLRGTMPVNMEIPPARVPLTDLGLSSDRLAVAAEAFESSPESFVSSQMTCDVSLDAEALMVRLRSGTGFALFAINPETDQNLAQWIREHRVEADQQRRQQIAAAGRDLCNDKMLKESGVPVVFDAARYRDNFALNAQVKAFGFLVEAVTGNTRSPCVHEDANGVLYFVLPQDTTTFSLRGRSQGAAPPLFPGEYRVNVAAIGVSDAPATDADANAEDGSPEDSGAKTQSSDPDAPAMEPPATGDGMSIERPAAASSAMKDGQPGGMMMEPGR